MSPRLALVALAAILVASPVRAGDPAPPAAPAPAAEKIGGHDEAWWRKKATGYREDLSKAEAHVAACEKKADADRLDSGLRPLDACASQISGVEHAEDRLADFEAKARDERVPPAWVR